MKKIKFLIILFLFLGIQTNCQSTKTPYEQKIEEINVKAFKLIGVSNTLITQAKKENNWKIVLESSEFYNITKYSNRENLKTWLIAYTTALKEAEKYKNEKDFLKDKVKKDELEKLKEQENYLISDENNIIHNIENDLNNWLTKGEFEKKEDWNDRINTKFQSFFNKICYDVFINRITIINNFRIKLDKYDSEKESFIFYLVRNNENNKKIFVSGIISVPINDAQDFKEFYNEKAINIAPNESEWRFEKNNLFPTKFVDDFNGKKYIFIANFSENDNANISIGDLNINYKPIESLIYSFNKNKEEIELARKKIEAEELEQQRIKLEQDKRKQEILRRQKEEKIAFENSDYGQLKSEIKNTFLNWLERKEFETQPDFEKRIKTNYESEFNKIVADKIKSSLRDENKIYSAALGTYDIEKEEYEVKIFREYNSLLGRIKIKIPLKLAESLKTKFSNENASFGKPLLVHILENKMVNNMWQPYRIFIIFSNGAEDGYGSKGYYDSYYWNSTRIIENSKDHYSLGYANNISINPVKLKNIETQFENKALGYDLYYYDYKNTNITPTELDFSLEKLEIKLPF